MKTLVHRLLRITELVGALLVLMLIILLFSNIVARELLSISLVWTNEVSLILFAWAIFLGAAVAFARGARIRFTFLVDRLAPQTRELSNILTTWAGALVLIVLFVISVKLVQMSWNQQLTSIPV
ncbi:MAG TPA: TRAP transporter small permease subunit, partial [Advenella sp.]|nr:TRAP transporter small permease subunit [Advenella sp.]